MAAFNQRFPTATAPRI